MMQISIKATQILHQRNGYLTNNFYKYLAMLDCLHNNFWYYPGSSQVITIHMINMCWQLLMSHQHYVDFTNNSYKYLTMFLVCIITSAITQVHHKW